jgi:hypothetical protein
LKAVPVLAGAQVICGDRNGLPTSQLHRNCSGLAMINTLSRFAAVAVLSLIGASGLSAQTAPTSQITVLELFTSQGCSSCPAADALFKTYVERPDVVAVSFSVDYWDYLGWKDTLASPKFTERQRGYGKSISNGQIYTPQMVVNGMRHVVGSSRGDIDAAMLASRGSAAAQAFRVDASRVGDGIAVQVAEAPTPAQLQPATGVVWLLTVRGRQTIMVKRGENSGHALTYFNSVREVVQVGEWTGRSATFRLPAGATPLGVDERYAVFIQRGAQGSLLGAGWVK